MSAVIGWLLGNLWRTAALALFGVLAAQTLYAGLLRVRLQSAEATATAADVRADAARSAEQQTAAIWELRGLDLQRSLSECQRQWADLQTRTERAVALAIAGRRQAEDALAAADRRFAARSAHCGAALIDAGNACAELEGY